MNREKIEKDVKRYIDQSIAGGSQEIPKFDFKTKWYNLKDPNGLAKFLKITSAIANTPGLDGYIVFGFDEKAKRFEPARLADSGLNDSNLITKVINKSVQRAFDINVWDTIINEVQISIVHIPPSVDKPHVISSFKYLDKGNVAREEKEKIFIRKGTNTVEANRFDIDFMYYDRKNLEPEYQIYVSLSSINGEVVLSKKDVIIEFEIGIENTGLRPILIQQLDLTFSIEGEPNFSNLPFSTSTFKRYNKSSCSNDFLKFSVLEANKLISEKVQFKHFDSINWPQDARHKFQAILIRNLHGLKDVNVACHLINGKTIYANVDYIFI